MDRTNTWHGEDLMTPHFHLKVWLGENKEKDRKKRKNERHFNYSFTDLLPQNILHCSSKLWSDKFICYFSSASLFIIHVIVGSPLLLKHAAAGKHLFMSLLLCSSDHVFTSIILLSLQYSLATLGKTFIHSTAAIFLYRLYLYKSTSVFFQEREQVCGKNGL